MLTCFGCQDFIENELGPGTVELLRQIKQTLDPQNIMVGHVSLELLGRSKGV